MKLDGTHAIVTGGSSGIGLAAAAELAARGAHVSLVARDVERLDAAAAGLRARGADVRTASADVADAQAVAASFRRLVDEAGPCDVLVTSAGVTRPGHFMELDDSEFRRQMEINYFGTLHCIRQVVPSMVERHRGSIVGVSSAAGLVGVFGYTAYAPTKFAVRGLLESLRGELAPRGVHVACVYPPDVDTPMLADEEQYKPAETKAISGTIKPIEASVVARAIVRGIERERFVVVADAQTRLLARAAGLLGGTLHGMMDRKAAKAGSPAR